MSPDAKLLEDDVCHEDGEVSDLVVQAMEHGAFIELQDNRLVMVTQKLPKPLLDEIQQALDLVNQSSQ